MIMVDDTTTTNNNNLVNERLTSDEVQILKENHIAVGV